jgi:Transposase IS66 family
VVASAIAAQDYVQQQPVVNVDETGFKQYNGDGENPGKKRGWLWVVVTPLVSFFTVALSRSQATAQAILGNYTGLVGSDRCPSYGWLENDHRQVCWAHLLRDFQAMAERSGASAVSWGKSTPQGTSTVPLVASGQRWHHVESIIYRGNEPTPRRSQRDPTLR